VESIPVDQVEAAVFLSGVVSMALEILAGRMIAPEFGSSVYTWGSVIGVFMAALAIGYHKGGENARNATRRSVSIIFLGAALYIALLILLSDRILLESRALGLGPRFAPLVPATLLFGPPALLLGYISPYAAQLSATDVKGEASGRVYALGTAGSIVGTFAATFVLVPFFGVNQVLGLLAAVSLLSAVVASIGTDHLVKTGVTSAVSLAVVLLLVFVQSSSAGAVYATQTPYQDMEIRDSGGVRTLYLDGQPQSAAYTNGSALYPYRYPRYFHLPFLYADDPGQIDDVLFVGAGGFSGPRRFSDLYNLSMDVVEIDPEVVSAGKRYFNASELPNRSIHVADGRRFLRNTNQTYDLVVLDAYRKASVPFHLTTQQFLKLVRSRMSEDGAVVANLISGTDGPTSRFYRSEYKTISRVFPQVHSYRTSEADYAQNIELVATKNESAATERELLERNSDRDIGLNLSSEVRTRLPEPDTSDVPVLTDDRAPVSRLTEPMLGTRYTIEGSDPRQ
jgi:spermidine synthase